MVDQNLLEELSAAIEKTGGIIRLPEAVSSAHLMKITDLFVAESSSRWWWESLSKPSKRINYGSEDGLSVVATIVKPESKCILVVTDDEDPPWPVYSGEVGCILEALRECRFFEYFLAAEDASWILFDTHMNEVIVSGELAGS